MSRFALATLMVLGACANGTPDQPQRAAVDPYYCFIAPTTAQQFIERSTRQCRLAAPREIEFVPRYRWVVESGR